LGKHQYFDVDRNKCLQKWHFCCFVSEPLLHNITSNLFCTISEQQTGIIGIAYIRAANYSTENNAYNLAALKRGTGGRSSFNGIVATVFGCTGFVGRYVCNRLGKVGTQVTIPIKYTRFVYHLKNVTVDFTISRRCL
jgi:uncharacterized membrane protein